MKRSVCSQLMFVILFLLQSQQLQTPVKAQYSERIYIVKSLVEEHAYSQPEDPYPGSEKSFNQQEAYYQHQSQVHTQNHQGQLQQHQQLHHHQHQYQQQLQNHHDHVQQQQQQQQPQQIQHEYDLLQVRQSQYRYIEQRQSHVSSMQQVLLEAASPSEWKYESVQEELSEIFVNNGVSSYPVQIDHQLAYYQHHIQQQCHHSQQYYHQQHHQLYSKEANDDHDYELNNDRPIGSCASQNPSTLMQSDLVEPICKSTSASSLNNPANTDSSRNVPNFSQLANKPSHNSNIHESFPLTHQQYHYESSLISAIRHYWREVSGLCLASAIFLNWLFVVIKRRFVASGLTQAEHTTESIHQTATRSISKETNCSSAHDSAFEDNTTSPIGLDDNDSSKSSSDHKDKSAMSVITTSYTTRQRTSTLKAEPIPIPMSLREHNSISTSLSNSLNTSEYNSRYSSDFDSIQRLGRGGFGIVFEAKNKIDDCHYAVKRICLPLEKEARERVMREVRALAKLDHAGIVRYYNAWIETPPDDWLKQHDAQLGIVHSRDGMSFPSTDGIYERNESENYIKGTGKMNESGDNISGMFATNKSHHKRRVNGFNRFFKNNSSSPSLDIVFEGSGSIRLESEDGTEKTNSNGLKVPRNNLILHESNFGDNNSDSEDSDFIQFESKSNTADAKYSKTNGDWSISSHLTDPFSSSESELEDEKEIHMNSSCKKNNIIANKSPDIEKKNILNYQKELRQLNNASLVENLHVEKVYLYIQMQLCRKDTLKDWLKTNCDHRDKTTIFDLFYQIVDAVEYVHSQDLIHRDLKPSNIFFSLDGTLKIGDFGLCRAKTSTGIGSSLDLQEYVAESDAERSFEAVHTEQVGTQLYMSPEQLNGLSYNQKVDIFAMGLILLELLIPFRTQMQRVNVLFKARNSLYSDEFKTDHPQEYELVKTLLCRSPLKRPTATEIKQHELLASAQLSQPVIERIYHRRRTISSNSSTE